MTSDRKGRKLQLKTLEVQVVHSSLERICEEAMKTRIALVVLGKDMKGTKRLAAEAVMTRLDRCHNLIVKSIEALEKEYGAKPTPPQEQKLYMQPSDF